MDKYFGRKGMWIVLGVLALLFLCIVAGCLGTATLFAPRQGGVWMQAPASEDGAAPPMAFYPAHGRWGPLGIVGAGLGLVFKLLFFGLLVLLLLKLVGRVIFGHCHPYRGYWYGPWRTAPQGGPEGEAAPEADAAWGPSPWRRHAWRHHPHRWGPPPWWGPRPQARPAPEAGAGEEASDRPDSGYTGPQE